MADLLRDQRERGWFWDVNALFEDGLSSHAIVVRTYLARLADNEGRAFPSVAKIAKHCGISRSTAVRALRDLVDKGWIERESRLVKGSKERDTTVYTLLVPDRVKVGSNATNVDSKRTEVGSEGTDRSVQGEPTVGSHRTREEDPITKTQLNKNGRVPSGTTTGAYPEEFESFWSAYPRKLKKKLAYSRWLSAQKRSKDNPNPTTFEQLITAAKNYARSCRERQDEERFMMHPTSFLSLQSRAWEDYLSAPQPQKAVAVSGVANASAYSNDGMEERIKMWKQLYPDEYDSS